MARITVGQVEALLYRLNSSLNLPTECLVTDQETGRTSWSPGSIFLERSNGCSNIRQVISPAGGVRDLAPGLTLSEAHRWVSAACIGADLARTYVS